ncbi:MAG TPA: cysteine desulfurase family protein [Planctomycetaceae bacterium]|nr:cysteine desulfurase family protein [Planctomycetaceae bacterium]
MTAPDFVYLDNNATTRPYPEVVEALARHFRDSFGNPGSRHAAGRRARQALELARESIANILGATPKEVIFTSGGTESTNLAIFGFAGRNSQPGAMALTAGEHPATMEACRWLERAGWRRHTLEVDADGLLKTGQYERLPWDDLKLVTVILAHNETGVLQDVQPLARMCGEHGVPFHLDAVQAVGKIPVHFHELGVTSLALGAHKFHGPRGIGALLLREGVELAPYLFGGHQEAGRRPGTEPVALAVGMARALEIWNADHEDRTRRVRELRDRLEAALLATCAPAVVNGARERRLPNTLNIAFPGLDGEALLVALDLEGVACSLGSTCASGSAEPAPALVAMGKPADVYRSSVRFSVGQEGTAEEIDEAASRIARVVGRLRAAR